jgi:hypothetical protein
MIFAGCGSVKVWGCCSVCGLLRRRGGLLGEDAEAQGATEVRDNGFGGDE